MPLSKIQSTILELLAEHRDLESYVAASSYLTRGGSGHFHASYIQGLGI